VSVPDTAGDSPRTWLEEPCPRRTWPRERNRAARRGPARRPAPPARGASARGRWGRRPRLAPRREGGRGQTRERARGGAGAAPPGRPLRGLRPGRRRAAPLRARRELPRRQHLHPARSVCVRAHARRPRPPPRGRRAARGALRTARRAPARGRRRPGHRVRRLGPERPRGERRRRLQRLGWPAQPDALARRFRDLGALRPRRGRGRALQVRAEGAARRAAAAEGRPLCAGRRGPAGDSLARLQLGPPVARRRLARGTPRRGAVRPAGLDLRGPPRVVAPEPARKQPVAHLPRARRRAGRLRDRPRLHARRAAAGDAPPVSGASGSPTSCARSSTGSTAAASA